MLPHAVLIGWVIAYGELAIGLGTLLGLKTRIAAIAGAFLSLNLFLAVSFHSSPYFTGADIVFLFAWMPLIIAGGGSRLSADALIRARAARQAGFEVSSLVAVPFDTVQRLCGHFDAGRCRALSGAACAASKCPVLLRAPQVTPVDVRTFDRRTVVIGSTTVAVVAGAAAVTGFLTTAAGHMEASAVTGQKTSTPSTLPGGGSSTSGGQGTLIGPVSSVPVGSPATFTIPSSGDPGIVFQLSTGNFVGYDAVCPHAGCTVGYSPSAKIMVCPCHGSEFVVATGQVIQGPAPHGLTPLTIVESSNGNLYLQ
jgi:thiosulfate dehydrogenase [quinone] large subunit